MANIEIKLNSGVDGDKVNSVSSQYEANNVSIQKTGNDYNKLSTRNSGKNMKSWATGSLSLSDGYVGGSDSVLVEQYGYNGYIFGVVPENKELSVTLTITGENLDSLVFYGDKESNQFPTIAYLDGDTSNLIYSDDVEWAIKFDNASSSHTITFLEWNRANYNACLTFIGTLENWLTLDKSWIKSVESLSQSTSQPKEIFYGVVPSRGSIEILDRNGEIKDYVEDGILITPQNIDIIVNGQLLNKLQLVENNYEISTMKLNSSLQSIIGNILDIPFQTDLIVFENISLFDVLFKMFRFGLKYSNDEFYNLFTDNEGNNNLVFINYYTQTMALSEYLDNINIKYFIPYKMSYREIIDNILKLAQMYLIEREDGTFKFVSARPIQLPTEKTILIPKKQQFSQFEYDVVKTNIYNNVQASVNNINYSAISVYEKTFSVRDNYGILSASNVNNSAKLEFANGNTYLYFFVDVDSNNPIYDFVDFSYLNNGVNSYEIEIIGEQESIEHKSSNYLESDETKDSYKFKPYNYNVTWLKPYTLQYHSFVITLNLSLVSNVKSIRINLMGKSYSEEEQTQNFNNKEKNIALYPNSKYLTNKTTFKDKPMFNVVAENILEDYNKGIATATISIGCADYFYTDNSVAKSWNNGEIISLGEVVKIEGNDKNWRVVGCNFRKVGVPMIDLELQELKSVEDYAPNYELILNSTENDATIEFANANGVQYNTLYESYVFNMITGELTFLNPIIPTACTVDQTYYSDNASGWLTSYLIKSEVTGTRMSCMSDTNSFYVKKIV